MKGVPLPRSVMAGMDQPKFVEKAWEVQRKLENRTKALSQGRYGRVLRMARKPSQEEFNKVSKVTSIGIMLIGAIGFVVYLAMRLLPGGR